MAEPTAPPQQSEYFEADLPNGNKLIFSDLDELKDFCKEELEFWGWLQHQGGVRGSSGGVGGSSGGVWGEFGDGATWEESWGVGTAS